MKTARLILMLLLALMVSAQAGAQDEDTVADTLQTVETPSDELQVQVKAFSIPTMQPEPKVKATGWPREQGRVENLRWRKVVQGCSSR